MEFSASPSQASPSEDQGMPWIQQGPFLSPTIPLCASLGRCPNAPGARAASGLCPFPEEPGQCQLPLGEEPLPKSNLTSLTQLQAFPGSRCWSRRAEMGAADPQSALRLLCSSWTHQSALSHSSYSCRPFPTSCPSFRHSPTPLLQNPTSLQGFSRKRDTSRPSLDASRDGHSKPPCAAPSKA